MSTTTEKCPETAIVARIAGEDISRGDYVAVMSEIAEYPSYLWSCSSVSLSPQETVRLRFLPLEAGQPRKVIGVCLPFVYVKTPCQTVLTFDTRQQQLVRLDRECARAVWKEMKSPSKKRQQ